MGDTRGMLKPRGRALTLVWAQRKERRMLVVGGTSFKIAVNMSTENNDGLVRLCALLCVWVCMCACVCSVWEKSEPQTSDICLWRVSSTWNDATCLWMMDLCLLAISINNAFMPLFFNIFCRSCFRVCMWVCVPAKPLSSFCLCFCVPNCVETGMYHILVMSVLRECIIHFHLGSCNSVCVCVCPWSKCVCVNMCVRERETELAHLCNNLGLDVSGHFYKC